MGSLDLCFLIKWFWVIFLFKLTIGTRFSDYSILFWKILTPVVHSFIPETYVNLVWLVSSPNFESHWETLDELLNSSSFRMALVGATSLFHSLGNNMICKSIRKRYCFALNLVIFCLQLYTFIKVMHLFGGTLGFVWNRKCTHTEGKPTL